MIHFDERRHHLPITRWPADEEPLWRKGRPSNGKPKKNRKKDSTKIVPKTIRIDVIPEYKSGLCKNVYWMHPNMALTRESREREEFVGEVAFYPGENINVIVNFFTGLELINSSKLRFSHTAHTPPLVRDAKMSTSSSSSSSSNPTTSVHFQKNMELLVKKLDILAFKQAIIESRPKD